MILLNCSGDVFDQFINAISDLENAIKLMKLNSNKNSEKLTFVENKLVNVADKSSASTANLNEVCENIPPLNQINNAERSLSILTDNVKKQTVESNSKLNDIVKRLEDDPVKSLCGQSERFQQFQHTEPHHHSSPNRSLLQNHTLMNNTNSVHTHEVPGVQTQNEKSKIELQTTALQSNSQNDNWQGFLNSSRYDDDIKKALKSQRSLCRNSISISNLNIDTNNEMDSVSNNVEDEDFDTNKSNTTDQPKNCQVLI